MPGVRFKCPLCSAWFGNHHGCRIHIGMKHKQALGSPQGRKRARDAAVGLPAPVAVDEDAPDDDDDGEDTPLLERDSSDDEESDDEESAHEESAHEEEPTAALTEHDKLLEAARAEAREMLLDPTWRKYAEEQRLYYEETLLKDVGALYPSADQYENRETYRFLKLYYEHPGASFGPALLKENEREHLDLDKVGPHACICGHSPGRICVAYATCIAHWRRI